MTAVGPEGSPKAPLRARWIALRTLRQQVEPTGESVDGHPVYVAGGTRLVLPEGAHHFRVLRPCALCGKEMTGRPVLHPSGVGPSADQHMCQECSAGATGVR